jgi:hypothetical protein
MYFLQRSFLYFITFNIDISTRMGLALYKADFLHPHKKEPAWFRHEDVGPYINNEVVPPVIKNEDPPQIEKVEPLQ